jgi:hypothetical protein
MLVVQNQWNQKDYGLDSGDVAEETHSVLKNKPSPKPCTKSSQTLKNKKTDEMRKSHKVLRIVILIINHRFLLHTSCPG